MIPIGYAICKETITSPWADEVGMEPNKGCGCRVPIYAMGGMGVLCQCPIGHQMHVMPDDLKAFDAFHA